MTTNDSSRLPGHRVLLLDDHPFLRLGLAEAIRRAPGLAVCGAVATAEEALAAVVELAPDIVVADINLPGKSGLEFIKELAASHPGLPVLVLSMHEEEVYAERCLRAGARGYVTKNAGPDQLIAAIRALLAGEMHVSAETSARILESFSRGYPRPTGSPLGQLSDREFQVLQAIGRGSSTQQIADEFGVSVKTIESHRLNIKKKLGLATAFELVAYAARWAAPPL